MNIISVDLNWNPNGNRIAVAVANEKGNVRAVIGGLGDNELLCFIKDVYLKRNTPSLILLDIPIEGCESLKGPPFFRPVDLALVRNGFPLLPSSKAGQRGSLLKKRIQTVTGKSAQIYEIYPYAVYKFLSYLSHKDALHFLCATRIPPNPPLIKEGRGDLLDEHFCTFWPPKYKRERNKRIRVKNMRYVFSLLTNPQIGLDFSAPLQAPSISENLSILADKYDACLGTIVGIHLANKSPFAKIVGDKDSCEILLLADRWLAENLEKTKIKIR